MSCTIPGATRTWDGGASHGAALPFSPLKGKMLKIGDNVTIRNKQGQRATVLDVRTAEEPAPTLVAVKFDDPRLENAWFPACECEPVKAEAKPAKPPSP